MPIRITGMYSGLDTESIINELASAQSTKKNNLVKKQTRLSWKQDAWKALNTKIYSFYTNVVDNMRFQASFLKKTTKASNSNAVSVVTSNNAPNSVQSMKISQLAKEAYLTSGKLQQTTDGKNVTSSTKLKDLGFTGNGSFRVKVGNKTTDIEITEKMKISDVVSQLNAAGINASFDAKNQRFFLSSKSSGKDADFTITGNDAGGQNLLKALGFVSTYNTDSSEYKEYAKWASYATDTTGRQKAEADELAKLLASKKASTDALLKRNEELEKRIQDIQDEWNKTGSIEVLSYDPNDKKKINDQAEALLTQLYGPETQKMDDQTPPQPVKDEDGNPVMERVGGLKKVLDDANANLKTKQANGTATQADYDAVTNAQTNFNQVQAHYSYVRALAQAQNELEANKETIADNRTYYQVDGNGDPVLDADDKLQADTAGKAVQTIKDYFDAKIAAAQQYMADAAAFATGFATMTDEDKKKLTDTYATKIDGQDAEISLNGVNYTNSTNTFEINGLTITAQQETDEEITLTTTDDTDGIFDMVKNFFTEYNKLINEMDKLYNADANKGFDPLLSEEKSAMSDSEIEEWEGKVKESLLRRDSTLSTVSGAMKSIMLAGVEINGKKMYLSDFGINTLGYFNAADNEKSAYHINGDPDDPNTKVEDNILKAMIASDPDTVMKFFTGLSNNLHDKLDELMASSTSSSAFTVYNDKDMKEEYKDYTDKISKQETKVNNLIDKWYQKFSQMETALARLESKNNAVASMLGG
ncbi:MAG: flagellar filament capping protein FliD [Lachnospiraceae bacterium]|nr:flagellar filament capping protein FliD [Lachnospiraceae bacterium]